MNLEDELKFREDEYRIAILNKREADALLIKAREHVRYTKGFRSLQDTFDPGLPKKRLATVEADAASMEKLVVSREIEERIARDRFVEIHNRYVADASLQLAKSNNELVKQQTHIARITAVFVALSALSTFGHCSFSSSTETIDRTPSLVRDAGQ